MEKKLQKQFDLLETQRRQLLQRLSLSSQPALNKNPELHKWSVNQIIQHIILAEELSCKSIKAKVLTGNFKTAGSLSKIRELLLKLFLRSRLKFKAPVAVSKIPENLDFSTLCLNWDAARVQLQELLESLPGNLLNKYIFKHPVAGKMNIYGGLAFMQEHVRRHEQQIKRIIAHNEKL